MNHRIRVGIITSVLFCLAGGGSLDRSVNPRGAEPGPGRQPYFAKSITPRGEARKGYPITGLDFDPAGKTLAAANHFDLRLWDAASGKQLSAHEGREDDKAFLELRFVRGGERLVSVSTRSLRVWARELKPELKTLPGGTSLSTSSDGSRVAVRNGKEIRLYRTSDWQLLRKFTHPRRHGLVALSPDGRRVAATESQLPKIYPPEYKASFPIWDADTGRVLMHLEGFSWGAVFSPDSMSLAAIQENGIAIWELASRKRVRILRGKEFVPLCVAFFPNGNRVVCGGVDGSVCVWENRSGRLVERAHEFSEPVLAVTVSDDGTLLAAGGKDGTARIWTIKSPRRTQGSTKR